MVSYKIAKSMYIRKRNTVVDSYGWFGRSKDMAKGGKPEKESASALKVKHLFTLVYTRYISLIVDTKMYSWE